MKYKIGEILFGDGMIEGNKGKMRTEIEVFNSGSREIQVGSHYHFFEVNRSLLFEREKAFGKHLDVPAGASIRVKPGEKKTVFLVDYSGAKKILGFNGLTMGLADDPEVKENAMRNMRGFVGEENE